MSEPPTRERLEQLAAEGVTPVQAAALCNVPAAVIREECARYGITLLTKQEWRIRQTIQRRREDPAVTAEHVSAQVGVTAVDAYQAWADAGLADPADTEALAAAERFDGEMRSRIQQATAADPDASAPVIAELAGVPVPLVRVHRRRYMRQARQSSLAESAARLVAETPNMSKAALGAALGVGGKSVGRAVRAAVEQGLIPPRPDCGDPQATDCGRVRVHAWTDGSAAVTTKRGSPAAWGAHIRYGAHKGAEEQTIAGQLLNPSVYRAELTAVVRALEALPAPSCVTVYIDNLDVVTHLETVLDEGSSAERRSRVMSRGAPDLLWAAVNAAQRHHVEIVKVRAHKWSAGNKRADQAARRSRLGRSKTPRS